MSKSPAADMTQLLGQLARLDLPKADGESLAKRHAAVILTQMLGGERHPRAVFGELRAIHRSMRRPTFSADFDTMASALDDLEVWDRQTYWPGLTRDNADRSARDLARVWLGRFPV
jgi:hypothetical protein